MSKRHQSQSKAQPAKRRKTDNEHDRKQDNKHDRDLTIDEYFNSLDVKTLPLLQDLKNIISDFNDPCDYLENKYYHCFAGNKPHIRERLAIDNVTKTCCEDQCLQLLDLIINPPTEFYDGKQNVILKNPSLVLVSIEGQNLVYYNLKTKLFDVGGLVSSDPAEICELLRDEWPLRIYMRFEKWPKRIPKSVRDNKLGLDWVTLPGSSWIKLESIV